MFQTYIYYFSCAVILQKFLPNTFVRKIIRDYFRSQKIQGLSFLLGKGTARSADLDGFFKLFPKCALKLL